jgi:hypothetical protein
MHTQKKHSEIRVAGQNFSEKNQDYLFLTDHLLPFAQSSNGTGIKMMLFFPDFICS